MARGLHPVTDKPMQIWMSNTRSNQAYEREFFAGICDALILRRGSPSVREDFQSLLALALLPWLDQPRFLEPAQLISEIHDAWDELWTLPVSDSSVGSREASVMRSSVRTSSCGQTLGCCLARPLHELTVFAASGGKGVQLRIGTHRQLIVDQGWRVIRGGAAR